MAEATIQHVLLVAAWLQHPHKQSSLNCEASGVLGMSCLGCCSTLRVQGPN